MRDMTESDESRYKAVNSKVFASLLYSVHF